LCELRFDFTAESLGWKIILILPGLSEQFLERGARRITGNDAMIRVRWRDRRYHTGGSAESRSPETLRRFDSMQPE